MIHAVDGFWIRAFVFEGSFKNTYFHFLESPGQDIYATISLSSMSCVSPKPELGHHAFASIVHWTSWGADGKLVAPFPNSAGQTQNAVFVQNCGSLEFALEVHNNVDAVAQINIFQL